MYEFKSFKLAGKGIDTEMRGDGVSVLTPKKRHRWTRMRQIEAEPWLIA
jgi:hypothetical protein